MPDEPEPVDPVNVAHYYASQLWQAQGRPDAALVIVPAPGNTIGVAIIVGGQMSVVTMPVGQAMEIAEQLGGYIEAAVQREIDKLLGGA